MDCFVSVLVFSFHSAPPSLSVGASCDFDLIPSNSLILLMYLKETEFLSGSSNSPTASCTLCSVLPVEEWTVWKQKNRTKKKQSSEMTCLIWQCILDTLSQCFFRQHLTFNHCSNFSLFLGSLTPMTLSSSCTKFSASAWPVCGEKTAGIKGALSDLALVMFSVFQVTKIIQGQHSICTGFYSLKF